MTPAIQQTVTAASVAAPLAAARTPRMNVWPVATMGTMLLLIAVLTVRLLSVSQRDGAQAPASYLDGTVTALSATASQR